MGGHSGSEDFHRNTVVPKFGFILRIRSLCCFRSDFGFISKCLLKPVEEVAH